MSVLIKNVGIVTLDDAETVIKQGFVGISGEMIDYIGEVAPSTKYARTIDGAGKVVMPGLVNAHAHSAMTLLRGYADDMNLQDWLEKKIFPAEDKMTEDDVYWGSALAIAEMIKSGTIGFADMYFFSRKTAEIAIESGVYANIGGCVIGGDDDCKADNLYLARAAALYKDFHGSADGKIKVEIAPHAVYTCSEKYLRATAELADTLGASIHTHLSETEIENINCQKTYGVSPTELMNRCGILNKKTTCAHGVWLSDSDMEILKSNNATVVHNPVSNLKLASGVARVVDMQNRGITVALGTDGAASNNNLDLFEEIKLAAMLHKGVTLNPTVLPANEVLKMATTNGYLALGLENSGSIEAGKYADMILLDFNKPHLTPNHNTVSNIVYSANGADVDTVIVRGKILMENRELKTLDEEKILAKVSRFMV
ncbi:MAG: amidohydrolase [Oscillospiraceae bacterium]|nr:amidohydrolase [Oscillospiraceae bacterium]